MSTIVVYGPRRGSGFRVHWALAELNLPYEAKALDFAKGEHKSPEYLAINPAGQSPAMVHDGFILTESAAIVHYLADKYQPDLLGTTPELRATGMRWELFVMLNIHAAMSPVAFTKFRGTFEESMKAPLMQAIERYMLVLEGWLAKNDYLAGSMFTAADIVARAAFQYAEMIELDLSAYPSILAWMQRCAERPAYAKASQG